MPESLIVKFALLVAITAAVNVLPFKSSITFFPSTIIKGAVTLSTVIGEAVILFLSTHSPPSLIHFLSSVSVATSKAFTPVSPRTVKTPAVKNNFKPFIYPPLLFLYFYNTKNYIFCQEVIQK